MRTLKLTMMVALAFALGVANANAGSIDIIWQTSGTGTTVVTSAAVVTGDIVLTVGGADTGLGGVGAGFGLSADSTGSVIMAGSTNVVPVGWLPLGAVPAAGTHTAGVVSFGDLFGSGTILNDGNTPLVIGTITVNAGATGGTVLIGATSVGDDLIASAALGSVLGQYSFGGGNVIVPEPTTASLLGLGLLGLSIAGRNRKN